MKLGLRQNPVHRVVKNGVRFAAAVLLVAVLRADVRYLEFELVRRTGRITGRVVGNVEPRINAKLVSKAVLTTKLNLYENRIDTTQKEIVD